MYMSYCRFEGASAELRACYDTVYEHIYEEANDTVSDREIKCFKQMVMEMVEFLQTTELIDGEGNLDKNILEMTCEAMAHKYQQEDEEE